MKKPGPMQRLRAKSKARMPVVGVTWYSADNWARVKAAATDPDRFEATYADWHAMAVDALADLRKAGIDATPFNVDAGRLLAWCLMHNKPNNAASRAEFVSEMLRTQGDAGA